MLACWDCKNLTEFVQVSRRGDSREITQTPGGLRTSPFGRPDDRPPSVYSALCRGPIEADIDDLGLPDQRLDFVAPADFAVEPLLEELTGLRPDAEWSRLELPAQQAVVAELKQPVCPEILQALTRTNRLPLFSHQVEAIDAALRGEQVVQATSAGSGKSLGFVVPVLDRLVSDELSTAMLMFPLRALANDQLSALARLSCDEDPWVSPSSLDLRLTPDASPIRIARYDGATPEHERTEIRRDARIVIATPDILHHSILRHAQHTYKDRTSWRRILRGLSFVVLDEIHTYQGVFGSNVANVLRRLRRAAEQAGSSPQFLAASATIGNPREHAERLTGLTPFTVVDRDGSARRRRVVLICNPPERGVADPTTKAQLSKKGGVPDRGGESGRIAPQTIALELMASALAGESHLPVRTIAFARSRNAVFQLAQRLRNNLKESRRNDLAAAVAPYAATFLADDRVEAEGKLRDGSTLAIVSTSALELGIDIPDLSLAVLVGYPGQISSFRQRAGRVGRSGEGLAVLIVGDDPLQQYFARRPDTLTELLAGRAEDVVINPDAPEIARRYGLIPAQEEFGGLTFADASYFGPRVTELLAEASGAPDVELAGAPYWQVLEVPEDAYPGIRNAVANETYTVVRQDRRDRQPIGTIDAASAPEDAFVPAIWTGPDGDLFRVVGFDPKLHEIYCEGPVEVGHQTRGVPVDRVEVRAEHMASRTAGALTVGYGQLQISRQVFNYREQHFSGVEVSLPVERGWAPIEFVTDGLHIHLDPTWFEDDDDREGSVRALEHVVLSVAPALVACDPYDLDASSDRATVFLYDSFGGGLRLSQTAFDRFGELVGLCHEIVCTCPCEHGCPACVMLSRRPDGNAGLSKAGAERLLQQLVTVGGASAVPE